MPSIDHDAKAYENQLAGWFAFAVRTRRSALKLTASELSRRTADLGYPISRSAIAKIESEVRSGKIDVAEVLVLARALDIPPALLLFPQVSTDGGETVLPGRRARSEDSVRWMSGRIAFPQEYDLARNCVIGESEPPNDGVKLITSVDLLDQALDTRMSLVHHLEKVQDDPKKVEVAQRMLEKNDAQIAELEGQIRAAREALWGMRSGSEGRDTESDG